MYKNINTPFGTVTLINYEPYPFTIVPARYGGTYEGGRYLAFPCGPNRLPDGWDDSDCECMDWWADHHDWPIGVGASPDEALEVLIARLNG
jgi:hypothetical protein